MLPPHRPRLANRSQVGWGLEGGTDLRCQEEGPATAGLSIGCEYRGTPFFPPLACWSRAPSSSFVLRGSPAPRASGVWEEAV